MRTYCFIFARGGSKGLPNKNIIDFGGLPLIVHSINIAKEISLIDKIIVSSDSDEILSISENHGAQTIKRPKDLASDEASEWLAWRHAVNVIKEKENFDLFLSLPPTAPLRSKEDILNLNDFADLASYELIDKEEGIFRKLDLEEDSVNQMIMEAREKIYS